MKIIFTVGQGQSQRPVSGSSTFSTVSSLSRSSSGKKSSKRGKALHRSSSRNRSVKDPKDGALCKSVSWGSNTMDTDMGWLCDHSDTSQPMVTLGTTDDNMSPIEYIQQVKRTFRKRPHIYNEFKQILAEMKHSNRKVEIVKRVVMLLDGYPHLILAFNTFLPDDIVIELQGNVIVVKADEGYEEEEAEEDLTMGYIRNVKWSFANQPETYKQFSNILEDFHKKSVSEVDTIHKIATLFNGHPDLVLGFNGFLPEGFKIIEDRDHGYVIVSPCKKGLKPHYTVVDQNMPIF